MNLEYLRRLQEEKKYLEDNPTILDSGIIMERLISITNEIQKNEFSKIFSNFQIPAPQRIYDFLYHYGDIKCSFYNKGKMNYCIFLLQKYYPDYLQSKLNDNIEIENYEDCALIKTWINSNIIKIANLPF